MRIAENRSLQPEQEDGERRLVNVTPIQMLTAGKIIELVAVEAVALDSKELKNELDESGNEEHCKVKPGQLKKNRLSFGSRFRKSR